MERKLWAIYSFVVLRREIIPTFASHFDNMIVPYQLPLNLDLSWEMWLWDCHVYIFHNTDIATQQIWMYLQVNVGLAQARPNNK